MSSDMKALNMAAFNKNRTALYEAIPNKKDLDMLWSTLNENSITIESQKVKYLDNRRD